ncbi:MAG TPA: hypothetical protein VNR87_10060, partial [Flavisolibacter sp.]|nr:hypothetical protein [Flavisolibacter sp.]
MRKFYLLFLPALLCLGLFLHYHSKHDPNLIVGSTEAESEQEEEGYDGPWERDSLEFEKTKDPFLGYVPVTRLGEAMEYTEDLKSVERRARMASPLTWTERGPIYDSLGPSNGNSRAGVNYTSGRITAILLDTLNDATGNTIYAGGIAGGLWKCTNLLSGIPNWKIVSDYFANMAVSSICQDPTNPQIMYFATGEATSNADAVYGKGVWKSVDGGATWKQLPSTSQYLRNFKIMCDNAGNVYLATRSLTGPIEQPYGLFRSKDGGSKWTNITPSNLTTNTICTDIEISSTGKLHASFGYLGTTVNHFFTSDPADVSPASGWTRGSGIRQSSVTAVRMELAALADTLYAVTVNSANNADSCYKSIDGGSTWTKQNNTIYTSGLGSAQGWYSLTLAINPSKSTEIMIGGLDAYRSTNSGQTISRQTFWVTTAPYVHADHHFMQWYNAGNESRILIGSDGGVFLSKDGGATFADKNRNLAIKQFYAADLHPNAGSNYVIAGAQDNGTHQLKYPGLASSIEVTGGDGAFVHINQKNPNIQFGSYVFNQYRRSVNGGQTWSQINYSSSAGLFINPFDYDDDKNIMYASWTAGNIFRWPSANTTTSANLLAIPNLATASAFKVSTTTPDRVFIGSNNGKLFRLDHADVASAATIATNLKNISGPGFPAGFLNCVNTGSTDDYLVAVFTNYGVNNVWYSKDGGANWSAIDGNLPDMPVRWAIFHPQYNNRLIIATETGVYSTNAVNGANTVWTADPGFPTVRTDMLKLRASDQTIVAATHGRGIYTAQLPLVQVPEIDFTTNSTTVTEQTASNSDCRGYKDYTVELGILYAPANNATLQVSAAGTATRGVDFDFTTNGDFNSPSDQ